MSAAAALWHLLNALAFPLWLGLAVSAATKLIWPRASRHRPFGPLATWASVAAFIAYGLSWAVTGTEGTMAGYAATLAAVALVLWWRVFVRSA